MNKDNAKPYYLDTIGKTVILIHMEGEPQMPKGLTGTIIGIDGINSIHVHWENGSSLALIPDVDEFIIRR